MWRPTPLGERYTLRRRLGAGAMGVVYEALDRERNSIVALKTLSRAAPAGVYRFKNEFRALADLVHTNLLMLYELSAAGDEWFFTMELIRGRHFLDYLRPRPSLPVPAAPLAGSHTGSGAATVTLQTGVRAAASPASVAPGELAAARLRPAFVQLANGISALHRAGYLHRDIKSSNVLVTAEGRVVLCDFGLVQPVSPDALGRNLEAHGVFGTVSYMSPEQAAGSELTEASDWYSFGVVLFAALTGRLPFAGPPEHVLEAKRTSEPPSPARIAPDAPADLVDLCVALLQRDPDRRPRGEDLLARLLARAPDPDERHAARAAVDRELSLIGRGEQLTTLEAAFYASQGGAGVVAYLEGSSGMGKTTLARAFLQRTARSDRTLALSGRCREQESMPYKALDSLVDALAAHLADLDDLDHVIPDDIQALARVFPVLGGIEGIRRRCDEQLVAADPQELRTRAAAALRQLLTALVGRQPVVVFLDDVQWGDRDSAALLAEVMREPGAPGLMLLCAYRQEDAEGSPFLRAFEASRARAGPPARRVIVGPMSPNEVGALVRAVERWTGAPAPVTDAAALAHETDGNPMFLVELLQRPRERQMGAQGSLHALLAERVAAHAAPARELLAALALAGRAVPLTVVSEVCDLAGDPTGVVRVLRASNLLRTTEAGGDQSLDVYHDRIREVVAASLPLERARELHARFAAALERRGADPHTLLAHYLGADDADKARAYAPRAARQAADALAFERAASLYQMSFELGVHHDADGHSIRVRLAEALANDGRGAEAAAEFLTAASEQPTAVEALDLRRRGALQLLSSGRIDEGVRVLRDVLAAVALPFPRSPAGALASLLWRRLRLRLRGPRIARRAAASADTAMRIDACTSAGIGLGIVDPIRAADFQARGLLLALRSGDRARATKLLAYEAGHVAVTGSRARARVDALLATAAGLARELDSPELDGFMLTVRGVADYLESRWRSSLQYCDEADALLRARCTGVTWELDMAHSFAAWALYQLGDLPELARRVPSLQREAETRGNRFVVNNLGFITPFLRLVEDDPAGALEAVEAASSAWDNRGFHLQHWNSLVMRCEIDLYGGDGRAAYDRVTELLPMARKSLLMRVHMLRVLSHHLSGRCALAAAATATSSQPLMRAVERHARAVAREGTPWALGASALLRATVAHRRGRRHHAIVLLQRAYDRFGDADMALHRAAVRFRLGHAVGGARGAAIASDASGDLQRRGVRNAPRLFESLSPGWAGESPVRVRGASARGKLAGANLGP